MSIRNAHWSVYFLAWTIGVTAAGAAAGALLFLVGGVTIGAKFTAIELVVHGLQKAGFVSFVWAVPIAITMCVMRGYKRRQGRSC
ncbi:hypothetical protein DB347_16355 [Opitutaceae bacterium EW11]|nr:hypothetical protein DB347_16355 [Opitutaceae bacterium EW11]